MRKKQRLILTYAAFSVLCIAASVAAAWALLAPGGDGDASGLMAGVTDELASGATGRAPELRFHVTQLPFRHFPGRRTHRLPEDMASGVALEDLDGDGRPDLFFVNAGPLGGTPGPCGLYRNRGGLVFEEIVLDMPPLVGMGVAAADYDADGDMDLYVTGYGRNVLLRNDGEMHFTDVTAAQQVGGGGFSAGACLGDADVPKDRYPQQGKTAPPLLVCQTARAVLSSAQEPPVS